MFSIPCSLSFSQVRESIEQPLYHHLYVVLTAQMEKVNELSPKVVYRQAGDRYVLVEYGDNEMNFNISYRIECLISLVKKNKTIGIVEMSQGVRSVLIEFDGYKVTQKELLKVLVAYETEIQFDENWKISKVFRVKLRLLIMEI